MKHLILDKKDWIKVCEKNFLWRSQYTVNKAYNNAGVLKAEWNKNMGFMGLITGIAQKLGNWLDRFLSKAVPLGSIHCVHFSWSGGGHEILAAVHSFAMLDPLFLRAGVDDLPICSGLSHRHGPVQQRYTGGCIRPKGRGGSRSKGYGTQ